MARWQTRIWRRLLTAGAASLLLMLGSACSVNRRMVRVETQVQLLNDSLVSGQDRMDQDFEGMAQLMQHNRASLETAKDSVKKMEQTVEHSGREKEFARLAGQIDRLQESAQELNGTVAEINSRAEAMNDQMQYSMRHPTAASDEQARYPSGNDNPAVKPNHEPSYTGRMIDLPEEKTQ